MNAKEELQDKMEWLSIDIENIKCASIAYEYEYMKYKSFTLPVGYNERELEKFMDSLDFGYDNGFGSQELFGVIWLNDGTWLSRLEYDGSEFWKLNKAPKIPEDLRR